MDILKAPAPLATFLLRIPLSVMFLQQGLMKYNGNMGLEAEMWNLPYIVWWFAAWGELGAGIGLLVAGLLASWSWLSVYGDLLTRFCGITICSIMTVVIWVGEPDSFMDVILYDNLHVLLWVGGLFFALRGNRT